MRPPGRSLPLSVKRRIDQICLAFEAAWKGPAPPHIEAYLAGESDSERRELLRELLLLDVDYRLRRGQSPRREEYVDRFPDDRSVVQHVFRETESAPRGEPAGTRIRYFGDYEILEEIGRGGMGIVYKARQLSLNRIVALKMIRAGQQALQVEIDRFRRESEAAARLQHPHIVAIHEIGEHEGQHYFSMDYVDGPSLAQVGRQSPLAARRAAQYVRTIAEAVHYAHEQGILHRDLKPSNILVDPFDQPRVTDFGLATWIEPDHALTASGQMLGTLSYMPPEQADGEPAGVGPASDVYSLGAILYELLLGHPPFRGESAVATLTQVIGGVPLAPRLQNPRIPRDLETICLKCLEKEPRRRYASAEALAVDLEHFLRGEPIRARPVGRVQRAWRWCRRNRLTAALLFTVAFLLVAGTAVSLSLAVASNRHARQATQRLRDAYLAEAQAGRWSGRPGRRFHGLDVLASAAAIRPSPELRDEAIACMALVDLRRERTIAVDYSYAVAFSPDLRRYARQGDDGNVSVRRMTDDRELLHMPYPGQRRTYLFFSPDGRYFARQHFAHGRSEYHIWDVDRRKLVAKLPAATTDHVLGFAPDGRCAALVGPDGSVDLHEIASGERLQSYETGRMPDHVYFHPAKWQIAVFTRGEPAVQIVDLAGGRVAGRLEHPRGVMEIAWLAGGAQLSVACGDSNIHVWDPASGRRVNVLRGHQGEVSGVTYAEGNSLLVSRSWDGTVRLWDPTVETPLVVLPDLANAIQLSPDGRRLALRTHDGIEIWEVARPQCMVLHQTPSVGKGPWSASFQDGGRLLATGSDDGARLYDLASGQEIARLPIDSAPCVRFSRDQRSLFTGGRSGIRRWPVSVQEGAGMVRIGQPSIVVPSGGTPYARFAFNSDGARLAAITGPAEVAVRNLEPPVEAVSVGGHPWVACVAISPDGAWLAAGTWGGSGVKIWNARTGKLVKDLSAVGGDGEVAFSPDARWLVTGGEQDYRFWQVGCWKPALRISRTSASMTGPLAFSPDGRVLAIARSRYLAELVDPVTGGALARLETAEGGTITSFAFDGNGAQLAVTSSNHATYVWDLRGVRRQLAAMRLDWEAPPCPTAEKLRPDWPARKWKVRIETEATKGGSPRGAEPAESLSSSR